MNTAEYQQALPYRLRLLEVKCKKSDQVPMELMEQIADVHAHEMWGSEVARGIPLPILDNEGEPVLYAFPFAIGRQEFPVLHTLIKRFSKLSLLHIGEPKERSGPHVSEAYQSYLSAIRHELKQFGTVYVSANRQSHPVPRVSHGLHPYFYNAELALKMAKAELGRSRPRLMHIQLEPPCYEYFEIRGAGKTLRLHVHTLLSEDAIRTAAAESQQAIAVPRIEPEAIRAQVEDIEKAWEYYGDTQSEPSMSVSDRLVEGGVPRPLPSPGNVTFLIPYHERVPAILWTRWCAPTAAAMVLAFWDHYVPVPGIGTWVGYERIVDYWLDHRESGHNVPNLLDEIITSPTYQDFANVLNGYNWSFNTVNGNAQNDWAWDELVAELHAGRPVRWQIYPPYPVPGHAVCVFGYRRFNMMWTDVRYVILYNTWTETQEEWLYNHYTWSGGGVANHIELNCYIPGGKERESALFIRYPYGGETYQAGEKNEIRFYAQQNIKIARIEYSSNGGHTWDFVVEMRVDVGWNRFQWRFPSTPTTRARIRIKGLSASREYLAGDGSFRNFTVE